MAIGGPTYACDFVENIVGGLHKRAERGIESAIVLGILGYECGVVGILKQFVVLFRNGDCSVKAKILFEISFHLIPRHYLARFHHSAAVGLHGLDRDFLVVDILQRQVVGAARHACSHTAGVVVGSD